MSKKKICIVINSLRCRGGTERVAVNLSNGFSRRGYEVSLIALDGGNPAYEILGDVNVSLINGFSIYNVFSIAKLKALVPNNSPVIVISMGRLAIFMTVLRLLVGISNRLYISEHVSYSFFSASVRFIKRLAYRFVDAVVVLTHHDYNLLRSCNLKVVCIPNFSNLEPCPNASDERIVLAVGRLTYQKAFDRLLRIWSRSKNDGWKLRIVGSGEDKESLIKQAHLLGITNSVEFVSDTPNIVDEYKKAQIFLMTSRYEGLPLVLIEAKYHGLAAIAFDCLTGPRDVIQDGIDGFLVPDGDEASFIAKLDRLLADRELLERFKVASFSDRLRFSQEPIIDKWINLLEERS